MLPDVEVEGNNRTFPEAEFVVPATLQITEVPRAPKCNVVDSVLSKLKDISCLPGREGTDDERVRVAEAIPVFCAFHYVTCHSGDTLKTSSLLTPKEAHHERFRFCIYITLQYYY